MEMLLDVILAMLMLFTSVWCWLIHSRLKKLRCDRAEISEFVGSLTTATTTAETVIKGLRTVGRDAEKKLLRQREGLQEKTDELSRLLDKAHKTIRRLDDLNRVTDSAKKPRIQKASKSSDGPKTALGSILDEIKKNSQGFEIEASPQRTQTSENGKSPASAADAPNSESRKTALFQALEALQ